MGFHFKNDPKNDPFSRSQNHLFSGSTRARGSKKGSKKRLKIPPKKGPGHGGPKKGPFSTCIGFHMPKIENRQNIENRKKCQNRVFQKWSFFDHLFVMILGCHLFDVLLMFVNLLKLSCFVDTVICCLT